MKQHLLSNDAVAMIDTVKQQRYEIKSRICDALCDIISLTDFANDAIIPKNALIVLQEYAHLIDMLCNENTEQST